MHDGQLEILLHEGRLGGDAGLHDRMNPHLKENDMTIGKNLGVAALLGTLIAGAALAQESGQAPAPSMPDQQEMQGHKMGDGMMDGGMMGGDMQGMMQLMQQMGPMMETCMEMMQAMNEHTQSHDHTGNDG